MKGLLLDTDVIIDFLRGQKQAEVFFTQLSENLAISVITVAELYAGIKDDKEKKEINTFLECFEIIHLSAEIAMEGGLFRKKYLHSHGTGLADALIAATAHLYNFTLFTLNKRHFPMLKNIRSLA